MLITTNINQTLMRVDLQEVAGGPVVAVAAEH